jgi:hypothetical protein
MSGRGPMHRPAPNRTPCNLAMRNHRCRAALNGWNMLQKCEYVVCNRWIVSSRWPVIVAKGWKA